MFLNHNMRVLKGDTLLLQDLLYSKILFSDLFNSYSFKSQGQSPQYMNNFSFSILPFSSLASRQ